MFFVVGKEAKDHRNLKTALLCLSMRKKTGSKKRGSPKASGKKRKTSRATGASGGFKTVSFYNPSQRKNVTVSLPDSDVVASRLPNRPNSYILRHKTKNMTRFVSKDWVESAIDKGAIGPLQPYSGKPYKARGASKTASRTRRRVAAKKARHTVMDREVADILGDPRSTKKGRSRSNAVRVNRNKNDMDLMEGLYDTNGDTRVLDDDEELYF